MGGTGGKKALGLLEVSAQKSLQFLGSISDQEVNCITVIIFWECVPRYLSTSLGATITVPG